jgi:restriction system protein
MAIPDYQALMLPVLDVAAQGETSVRNCIAAVADRLRLDEEDRNQLLPSGKQAIFDNRVHSAKTYLVQAGLLEITRRAHFRLTRRGSEVLAKHPARIDNQLLMQFAEFREFRVRSRPNSADHLAAVAEGLPLSELTPASTPEDRIETAYNEITGELQAALLDGVTQGHAKILREGRRRLVDQHGLRRIES